MITDLRHVLTRSGLRRILTVTAAFAICAGSFVTFGGMATAATYTVINTNASGSGSLEQAIADVNATCGSGPHTIDFQIPATDPNYGLRTAGVFTLLNPGLPDINCAGTVVDATTQGTWGGGPGQTNPGDGSGMIGPGGTVGVDGLPGTRIDAPEIEISASPIVIAAANVTVRGFAVYANGGPDIEVRPAGTGALIEQNVVGSYAEWGAPGGGDASRSGVFVDSVSTGTIGDNLIGYHENEGIELQAATGWLIEGNTIVGNSTNVNDDEGIDIDTSTATVRGNLIADNEGIGIDATASSGANTIENNTVAGNGLADTETAGIVVGSSGNVITKNVAHTNVGAGIMVTAAGSATLSRNSTYANGTVPGHVTNQIGIDLLSAGDNQVRGTSPFYSVNDDGDGDPGGNGRLNFPVIDTAAFAGPSLVVTGWAPLGATIEFFRATADLSGFGEGTTWISTQVEGVADGDGGSSSYGIAGAPVNGIYQGTETNAPRFSFAIPAASLPVTLLNGDNLVATATVGGVTSEFGGVITITNSAPVFSQDLGDRADGEGATISISAGATDPDPDMLTYSATGLPPGITINTGSGLISGVIPAGAEGVYGVTVTVDDGHGATDVDTFSWTITKGMALLAGTGGAGGGTNLLTWMNRDDFDPVSNEVNIGSGTVTSNVQAMDMQPGTGNLYAVSGDRLGLIDTQSGLWATSFGPIGAGTGAKGSVTFDDVEGIAFDPFNGWLYGVERLAPGDEAAALFRLDLATGGFVLGAFGGDDYAVIPNDSTKWRVTDLAIDPTDGTMFGIHADEATSSTKMITIDKTTGADTVVGGLPNEMRGLVFDHVGQLWGVTDDLAPGGEALYEIDKTDGVASNPRPIDNGDAYQAVAFPLPLAQGIHGRVFQDTAGDVLSGGQSVGDTANLGVAGATVKLYQDNAPMGSPGAEDTLVGVPATTDALGGYSFPIIPAGQYWVVVDSKTVAASGELWAEQTYGPAGSWCANGSGGTTQGIASAGPCYGGRRASVSDSLTTWHSGAEHIAGMSVGAVAVLNVDFGFSFNVVTTVRGGDNADDDGAANRTVQGSLRQFVRNANHIAGANAMRFVPVELTNADDGGTNFWWQIVATTLTTDRIYGIGRYEPWVQLYDVETVIDGRAYSFIDGVTPRDTNQAAIGTGGTVGRTGAYSTPQLDPELEILNDQGVFIIERGLDFQASDTTVRDLSVHGFGDGAIGADVYFGENNSPEQHPNIDNVTVANNVIGTGPASFSTPANPSSDAALGFHRTDGGSVSGNLIGFVNRWGLLLNNASDAWSITGNEIRDTAFQVISVNGSDPTGPTIQGNRFSAGASSGVSLFANLPVFDSNTVTDNAGTGISVWTDNATITDNVVTGNGGNGVGVGAAMTGNLISGNIFGSNTGQAIDLDFDGISPNTGIPTDYCGIDAGAANDGLDTPIIQVTGLTHASGLACAGATVELYRAADGVGDGGFGEGDLLLGSDVADGLGAWSITGITGLIAGDEVTAIAIDGSNNTSEFAANISAISNYAPVLDPIGDYPGEAEGTAITFTATATDPDLDNLFYSLIGAPAGASIVASGVNAGDFTWTPSESQGGAGYTFSVRVTDDGTPVEYDEESITITVAEVNLPPVLTNPGAQSDTEGDVVSVAVAGSDSDDPANALTYSATGLPAGLTINTETGVISGTVSFLAAGVHSVDVTLIDDGTPSLDDAVNFSWTIADAGSGLDILKVSDAGGNVLPGATVRYTITVTNVDTVIHNNVAVSDPLPPGTTFIPGSIDITAPVTYRHDFNADSYSGSDGSTTWATSWVETDVAGNPVSNEWDTTTNLGHAYALIKGGSPSQALERTGINLTGASTATLSFEYRRNNIDGSAWVDVEVSSNGGTTWSPPVFTIAGPANDAVNLSSGSIDISSYISSDMAVRFVQGGGGLAPGRRIYVDNVEVASDDLTVATGGTPPNLIPAGYHLSPGQVMTVVFEVTVDDPPVVSQVVNTASVTSDQQAAVTNAQATDDVTNRPPVAVADGPYGVLEGGTIDTVADVLAGVLFNDSDPDLDAFTAVLNVGPLNDTSFTLNPDGSFIYVHNGSETTTDSFTYHAFDGSLSSATVAVSITVTPVNEPPTLDPVADVPGAAELVGVSFTASGSDPDAGESLLFSLQPGTDPVPTGASIVASGANAGDFTWTPSEAQGPGSYSFKIRITDSGPLFDEQEFTITVAEVNLPPVLTNPGAQANTEGDVVDLALVFSDSDLPANELFFSATGLPPGLSIASDTGRVTGTVSYTAAAGSPYSVEVTLTDDGSPSLDDVEVFSWTITDAGSGLDILKASDAGGNVLPGGTIEYTVTVTNNDTVAHTGISVTDPLPAGTTYVPASTQVTTPLADSYRDDFFAVSYSNSTGSIDWSATPWAEGEGLPESNGPGASPISISSFSDVLIIYDEGYGISRPVDLSSFSDASLEFQIGVNGLNGNTMEVEMWNGIAWVGVDTVPTGFVGTRTVDVSAFAGVSSAIRFMVPAAPFIFQINIGHVEISGSTGAGSETNPGGPPPTLTSGQTLAPGQVMTVVFEVTVDDPPVVSQVVNTASVTSDQQPASTNAQAIDDVTNRAPVAVADGPYVVLEGGTIDTVADVLAGVLFNDSDPDLDAFTAVLDVGPLNDTSFTLNPDGSFVYVHNGSETTTDSFTYHAFDGSLSSATVAVSITVTPVNEPPTLDPVADVPGATELVGVSFTASGSDPDAGESLLFSLQPGTNPVPAGAAIVASGVNAGDFTWTPSEAQGPGSYSFKVRITDSGPLIDEQEFTITVAEVNLPPVLTNPGAQASTEGDAVSLVLAATDLDLPGNDLSFSAIGLPPGLAINPGTGVISGAVSYTAAAGSPYSVTVTATDSWGDEIVPEPVGWTPLQHQVAFTWSITDAGAALQISKVADVVGPVLPGTVIEYTVVASNQDNVAHTGVELRDALPAGTTFASSTVAVPASNWVLDQFTTAVYNRNDGTVSWAGDWIETSDVPNGSAATGEFYVHDPATPGTDLALELSGPSRSVERSVDLSGVTVAVLSFDFVPWDINDSNEQVYIDVWNGSSWTRLDTLTLMAKDPTNYYAWSRDITPYAAATTKVRFSTNAGMTNDDGIFVDNVKVLYSHPGSIVAGGAGPVHVTGLPLLPGEEITLTYRVSVDDPATVGSTSNTAEVDSDQQATVTANATNPLQNRAPVVNAGPDQPGLVEGQTASLAPATFTDNDYNEVNTATIDWGDGTVVAGTVNQIANTVSGSHVYADNGVYVVTVTVLDDDLASGVDTLTATVGNAAPVASAGPDQPLIVEGDTVNLAPATFTDAGSGDTHTATIDWGDGTVVAGTVDQIADTVSGTHVYADNGIYTVTVTVLDDDGGSHADSFSATVANAPPIINAGPNQPLHVEGDIVSLAPATFTDAGSGDTHTATIDWGDGTVEAGSVGPGTVAGSHVYADDGLYTVLVTVLDDDAGPDFDTLTVTVGNASPVLGAGGDQSVTEGDVVSLDPATFTDAGSGDIHLATIDWGDGTIVAGSVDQVADTVSGSHVFADDGIYTVVVTVTDDDGGSDAESLTVTVGNAAPVVVAGADQSATEGDTVSLDPATFTDAGSGDTHTATIDWGDGTVVAGTVGAGTVSGSHIYADDGIYTVVVTVTDDDGGSDAESLTVTVGNAAPVVVAGADQSATEGDTVSLDPATFTDAGSGDTHTATIDWGDGTVVAGTVDQVADTVSGSHSYATNGVYLVVLTVTDDDGGSHFDTLTVTVGNAAPVVVAGADQSVTEGDTVSLDPATFTDAGAGDTHTATIDWGDGTVVAGTVDQVADTVSGSHVYADNGLYTVIVTVTDGDGGSNADSLSVTAGNTDPVVTAGPDQLLQVEGDIVSLAPATFTDAGSADTHSATIDWGDATVVAGTVDQVADTVSGSHVYADDGLYTVTVTVIDDDGGSHADSLTVTVDNASPVVGVGSDQTVAEGDVVSLDPATFTDAGSADTHSATIDWGDGTVVAGTVDQVAGTVSGSHVYADNGLFTVTVTVTDDDGAATPDTLAVTVGNAAPVVDAGLDQSVAEGVVVGLDPASFTDAGSGDTHTATIDWGDGTVEAGTVGAGTVAGSHVYADNGLFTVTVTVTDDDGAATPDTLVVTVGNVAPVVVAGLDQSVIEGDVVSLDPASFTDAGSADTHLATVDWGDGTVEAGTVGAGSVAGSHVYADDGLFTVTVTVTDDDGAAMPDTLTVTVGNVAPVVDAGLDQSVAEGDVVSLDPASFTDAGSADTHTATIDWGDGTVVAGTVDQVVGTVAGSHVYADDGLFTVTVTVTDDDGAATPDTLTVTVGNVAPVVDAGLDQSVAEGDVVSLDPASFTDAGSADTHTATIDWGDGTVVAGTVDQVAGTVAGSHVYADNGLFTVTVTVTDDDGAATPDTLTVTVGNVAPVVDAGLDQSVTEGVVVSLDPASFTDAGSADTHSATIDWGDGTPIDAGIVGGGSVIGSHVYADNGLFTVTVTVTDDDGAATPDTLAVTVGNAAPVVDAGTDQTATEADVVTLASTFTDAGSGDTHSATIDWGDGIPIEAGTVDAGTVLGSHVYADDGVYTVTVTVTDDDGAATPDTLSVTVLNALPSADAGLDQTVAEGDVVVLDPASFTDAGAVDTHTATIDWGDGTPADAGIIDPVLRTVSGSHVYADNGLYTVTVTVTDDDGGADADTMVVTVTNVAPVVDAGADQSVTEGDVIALDPASFTDAGAGDTHTATVDWGDGSPADAGTIDPVLRTVSGSHVYADNGLYTVSVTVTDDDGAVHFDSFTTTVANDAPVVDAGLAQSVTEGDIVNLDPATFTDAGAGDTHTATIDWGDSSPTEAGTVGAGTVSGTHVYTDNGIYTITVTVTDDDGATDADTITLTVANAAPTVDAGPDGSATEGDAVALAPATFGDAGLSDTHTATIDWGDGTPIQAGAVGAATVSGSHAFADNGTYTVTVTVTDDDGASTADTLTMTIANSIPILGAGADLATDEGSTLALTATFFDASSTDTHTATIDWGDGTPAEAGVVDQSLDTIDGAHVYIEQGYYTVTVTVTDNDGDSDNDTLDVAVSNVAPDVHAGADTTAVENDSIAIAGNFTDAGSLDTHTADVNWGDGTSVESATIDQVAGTVAAGHVYPDDGTFTVQVTVIDDEGAATTDLVAITITNAVPVVSAGADAVVDEGTIVSLDGAAVVDAGPLDTHSAAVDWGDGTLEAATVDQPTGTVAASHVYADDGTYPVTVIVTDDDGGAGADVATTVVTNVPPVVDAGPDRTVAEAADLTIGIAYTDAGTGDTHTATVDWGDGNGPQPVPALDGSIEISHVYPDDGVFAVTVTVVDDDGAMATDTVAVTVTDVVPIVTITGDASAVKEGVIKSFSGSVADPGLVDTHTLNWQVSLRGAVYATGSGPIFTFVADEVGFFVVTLIATDQKGVVSAPVTVDLTAFADATPSAVDDEYTVAIGTTLDVVAPGVAANDNDAEGETLLATLIRPPENGTATFGQDGSFSYTHDGTQTAADEFTYVVSDSRTVSSVATVRITVTGLNRPPAAADDSVALDEDSAITFSPIANDGDPDGDALELTWLSEPAGGRLVLNGDGTFTYVPQPNWHGVETLDYIVRDKFAVEAAATATISVMAVNDAPVAEDRSLSGNNGSLDLDILAQVSDVDDDPLTLIFTQPRRGNVEALAHGIVRYTPLPGFNGSDSFTFTADDGNGGRVTRQVEVNVTGGVGSDDLVIDLVSLASPVSADTSGDGFSLSGMRLLVGSVMQTFDLLRLPLLVLALAFGLSLLLGLSRSFRFGGGPVFLPPSKPVLWAVVLVGFGMELPVRDDPGDAGEVIHEFPAASRNLMGTGRRAQVGREMWVEVETPMGDGWVEAPRVTRQITPDAFAVDDRPGDLIEGLARLVEARGDLSEITGERGLHVAHFAPPDPIHQEDVAGLLADGTVWSWWSPSGSIQELDGTFNEIIADPLAASIRRHGIRDIGSSAVDIPIELVNFPGIEVGDPAMAGVDGWRVFFDYGDDEPAIVAVWREGFPNASAMGTARGRRMLTIS